MSLIQSLKTDSVEALRKGDKARLDTLRFIVSQIQYKHIELQRELTDADVISVIRKHIKELTESITQYKTAGRDDLVKEHESQATMLSAYLPQEISDDELTNLIKAHVETHHDAYIKNPRAFTGALVGALKSHASPDRIVRIYSAMQQSQ